MNLYLDHWPATINRPAVWSLKSDLDTIAVFQGYRLACRYIKAEFPESVDQVKACGQKVVLT